GGLIWTFTGEAAEDYFGQSVSGAGDVNNDGFDDLIVGAYGNDAVGLSAGRAYVYSGQTSALLFTFDGEAGGDQFGYSVSGAGDVDNDGFHDLVVGAHYNNAGGTDVGRAYVYSGQTGGLVCTFAGEADEDCFGHSVSGAWAVDNDGVAGLIIGAYLNDAGGINAGRAYIYMCALDYGDAPDDDPSCGSLWGNYPTEWGTSNAFIGRTAPFHIPPEDPDADYWLGDLDGVPTYEVGAIEAIDCDWLTPPCDQDDGPLVLILFDPNPPPGAPAPGGTGVVVAGGPCEDQGSGGFGPRPWPPGFPPPATTVMGFWIFQVSRGPFAQDQPGFANVVVDWDMDGDYGSTNAAEWVLRDGEISFFPWEQTRTMVTIPFPVLTVGPSAAPGGWELGPFWHAFHVSDEQMLNTFDVISNAWDRSGQLGGYSGGETEDWVVVHDPEDTPWWPEPPVDSFPSVGLTTVTVVPSDSNCLDYGRTVELSSEGMELTKIRRFAPDSFTTGGEVHTEIVQMELSGYDSVLGNILIRERRDKMSLGRIHDIIADGSGDLVSAESFFDVYVEVELPDLGTTLNTGDVRMQLDAGTILSFPPLGSDYGLHPESPSIPLFRVDTTEHVGWICYTEFTPSPRGDANGDGQVNVADVVYLVNYLYRSGDPPGSTEDGDANCDGIVDVADVVFLVNYLYRSGDPPTC
ncbi:MAG: FG-GAP repeat protein, partial [Candidatus Zixiibacteriota bacterium]